MYSLMKSGWLLFLLFFYIGELAAGSSQSVRSLLIENICKSSDIPLYQPSMQSGDIFLNILYPGLSFDEKDLSFISLSADDLSSDIQEVDKAYRFSKLVNRIFIPQSSSFLLDVSLEEYSSAEFQLTSLTYNDIFCLPTIIPAFLPFHWSVYRYVDYDNDNYIFSSSLTRLSFVRSWLSIGRLKASSLLEHSSIVIGCILAKDLSLDLYDKGKPLAKVKNDGCIIIAFIMQIL